MFAGEISIYVAFPIACINLTLFYLPSHEAQHSVFALPGKPLRWLNEALGYISAIPLVIPYRVLRATHMEHHKHTNNPDFDPDYDTHAATSMGAIWASLQSRQPRPYGRASLYESTLKRLGRDDLILEAALYKLLYILILSFMAWNGLALEALLLWWLPLHFALTYLHFFLSWAPHNPNLGEGRYLDTASFRSRFGNIMSLGMQYHIVHHSYPRIPLWRNPRAYWKMRPILEAMGGRVDGL